MDSRVAYTALVALVAAVRLGELRLSSRHARSLLARGGVESGRGHLPAMVALHAGLLAAAPAEVWLLDRPFVAPLAAAALAALAAAAALRVWTLRTLGERWTIRVITLPGSRPVTGGPYRYVRHPNYLAVVIEVAALPLVHGAWLTAAVFSALNAALLAVRIRVEERALSRAGGYGALSSRGRFLPRGGGKG
ncbi:MAG: hypothetical protein D6718_08955 [Acidobacteria bacterium]|nr:MAG: hypothetical protein D6718_08955 [Acidobacteriota bacterium]